MKKEEDQGFKILGFATGWYNNYCSDCGKEFIGDKRAFQCLSCATESVDSMQLENAKLRGQLSETEEKLKKVYIHLITMSLDTRLTLNSGVVDWCLECGEEWGDHKQDCIVLEAQTWLEDKE